MKELGKNRYVYFKLERPNEIDTFQVRSEPEGGFDFLKGLGIIGYERTFKMWLRKFPTPIFIVAINSREMVSWGFVEDWGAPANDGNTVFVLRAIETLPKLRSKKIGFKLMLLILQQTTGYLLVKALTPDGEKFFRNLGFKDESQFANPPVDLSKHSGYLILPPYERKNLLGEFEKYFGTTNPSSSS
jgi:hypothetical protein